MAKLKKIYECKKCGHTQAVWAGQCPECKSWGSLVEKHVEEKKKNTKREIIDNNKKAEALIDIKIDESQRIKSDYKEFDRAIGGGLIKDSVTILTARPGAGKSTLLLQLSKSYADRDFKVLYISGEESSSQIKNRANRIMDKISENIWILSTNSMDNAIYEIKNIDPDIVILDSIQTFSLREFDNKQGSPVQTVECANKCVELAKDYNRKRAFILIAHMTKSGDLAGIRTLEHLVDTVLYLEGKVDEDLRFLSSTKNRFGQTGEIGLFSMQEKGLIEIENPSEYFTTKRQDPIEGSALSVIKEGNRLLEAEVESLVSKSFLPYPQRIGDSLKKDELNTLISILEERAGINLFDKNVIIKTTGGLKLKEQSANLCVMASIASSFYKKPIDNSTVFIAEVGLTGELKKVPQIEKRIRELERLGYKKVYIAKNSTKEKFNSIDVIQLKNIREVFDKEFN
ncbi:MAG: DNA repair protein RadA [Tissierellia bacterium]|nr:DNA repair protein RadA [Tissierellia bacterium]